MSSTVTAGGSTLEAMAAAVEGSLAVLIFVSEEYKISPNCRLEAEYTFEQRKPIIPILVQYGYKASGWLGMLKGTKLHFDCSTPEKLDRIFPALVKEIEQMKLAPSTPSGLPNPSKIKCCDKHTF